MPWFTNRGQVIQLAVGLVALVGSVPSAVKAWKDMKEGQLFSPGAILFYALVGVVVVSVTILMRGITRKTKFDEGPKPPVVVYTLDFKYLPASPLENGWKQAYNDDGVAEYGSDPEIPESLQMKVMRSEVAIHYDLPPQATLADGLAFTAKCSRSTMIFTQLMVSNKDGSARRRVWVKYYYGRLGAEPTHPNPNPGRDPSKWLPEQTITLASRSATRWQIAIQD